MSESAEERRCTQCRSAFPANTDHFYRNGSGHLHGKCKACHIQMQRDRYYHRRPSGTERAALRQQGQKRCSRCREVLPATSAVFPPEKYKDGIRLSSWCRVCKREDQAERYHRRRQGAA